MEAGQESAWVPQKASVPTFSGFHQMEKWQYFSEDKLRTDREEAESESALLTLGRESRRDQHGVVALWRMQPGCMLGRRGPSDSTLGSPGILCATEGPQLPPLEYR